jgi:hypothetical protein
MRVEINDNSIAKWTVDSMFEAKPGHSGITCNGDLFLTGGYDINSQSCLVELRSKYG